MSFWDNLMAEQGVSAEPGFTYWSDPTPAFESEPYGANYNVGDVIVGEIVEEG